MLVRGNFFMSIKITNNNDNVMGPAMPYVKGAGLDEPGDIKCFSLSWDGRAT
jgi:hypothetical protein